ncbi:MAG: ATP-dependent helicase UvrD/PcrA, partial [Patescibacteria group bacterium]|nr:ATP-dependent helicase UvrD/PcrA [Patescibacteria group bacterium]
ESGHKLGIPRHFVIYDRGDSKTTVKDALVELGHDPKQIDPNKILGIISREKGNFTSREEFEAKSGDDYMGSIAAEVWRKYDAKLDKDKALDFDDLLFKTAHLLSTHEDIREYYQNKWKYVHVDEYQDTNQVQYRIVQLLVHKHKNLAVVGDGDQCILPNTKISSFFEKKIENIREISVNKISKGELVLSAAGRCDIHPQIIEGVRHRNYSGKILTIKTKSGKEISVTPNHMFFADLPEGSENHFVYLMFSARLGYRIGIVQGSRASKRGLIESGLIVRLNQEKADKIWILKICKTRGEARYNETLLSLKYSIPTIVFHNVGRGGFIDTLYIEKLFSEIDTNKNAQKLFLETGLYSEFPHYIPQGTTTSNTLKSRINLRLTMFSDLRKTIKSPWCATRVSINTTDTNIKNKLVELGFSTRKGKRNDWRCEISRLDYKEAEEIAGKIKKFIPELVYVRNSFITNKNYNFTPAGNLLVGMKVPVQIGNKISEDEIIDIKQKEYSGIVYDLDIENTHNYIANGFVVHNCIYSWRGANIANILKFEEDYPDAKIVLLEQNYRSTQTILQAANKVIEKNIYRKKKNLFTKNEEGEKIKIYTAYDETDEANFIANTVREMLDKGEIGADGQRKQIKPDDIAVLYRANFQSRAIEDSFLRKNIAYTLLGTKFFERKEVKDVISYIRLALNPDSMVDVKRVINSPVRGIGKTTLLKVLEGKEDELPNAAQEKVRSFRSLLAAIAQKTRTDKASEVIKYVITMSGMEKSFKDEDEQERLENVRELVTLALKYDSYVQPEGIEKMLEEAALASDQDTLDEEKDKDKKPGVKLMTVHSSKGLEFDHVFITGLEQGLFPHERMGESAGTPESSEEERRLFYVALTRARKRLFLSHANVRTIFGNKQVTLPSEFLADIDDDLIEEEKPVTGIKSIFIDF